MRLHELTVTAFGPFAETVTVDFDDLSAGGLFLLTGDTGAGKSSVLDAVCFALYGEVPGDRHTARHLRSDHAAPDAQPRVELRLSVGARTFSFRRSPAWDRRKRRGDGTTRVQASVVVEELRGEEWVALTTRLDEAGHLVTDLLGMTCTQFTQVAMLPQNRFQAFLRAGSAERQAVLQRLFRTQRFEAVERWLVERRLDLHRRSQTCHDRTAGVVNRLHEAAGDAADWPEEWDLHALEVPADDGSLLAWAQRLSACAEVERHDRAAELAFCDADLLTARDRLERGREVQAARERGAAASAQLQSLDATADDERLLVESLAAHRRAAPVVPLQRRATAAATRLTAAQRTADAHRTALARLLDVAPAEVDSALLSRSATRLAEERAVAESWLPRERDLATQHRLVAELTHAVDALGREVTTARAGLADLAPRRAETARLLEHTRDAAASRQRDEAQAERVEAGWVAARDVERLGRDLTERRADLAAATREAQDLREEHLDLRELRISGMAAELATALAVGCSCPVCGSPEHPAPATSSTRVGRADEEAARQRYETADFARQTVKDAVTTLETQLRNALALSGGHRPGHWQRRRDEAAAAFRASVAAEARVAELERDLHGLDDDERRLSTGVATARVSLVERRGQLERAVQRCESLEADLTALLGGHGVDSVTALLEAVSDATATVAVGREAWLALERAVADAARADDELAAALDEAGFGADADVSGSWLRPEEEQRRLASLEQRRGARAAASSVLDDPVVTEALRSEAPDLERLTEAAVLAGRSRDGAHAAHEHAVHRSGRLDALLEELHVSLLEWDPVRRQHALTARLAALVEGKSVDNALKMRLSAYVLSERLRQVVAAANERLGAMTDERYTLEQVDEKGAGEQRGGLSLRVRDEWSGKQRDPATLSGGETFLASLALALGLADTVSHEAGGTQLDTLFIDEGFGALDATTLDGVMDTLDSLRDGGRVVGLVSHVAELRNRVTSRLEVRKGRHGSTLAPMSVTG